MPTYVIVIYAVAAVLALGVIGTLFLNARARKSREGVSDRLRLTSIAFLCVAGVYAYYAYWILNGDALRMMFTSIMGAQAAILLLLVFVSSKHTHKSDNLPSVIRASIITFVTMHLILPAFPMGENASYVFFRFINDEVAATIGFMIAVFMLVGNIILLIAQLIMFFKARRN